MGAHFSLSAADLWKSDPLHPLNRIIASYERAMTVAPYSDYNPEAADEIDELVMQANEQAEKLSDLMWSRSAYLSDPDKS